MPVILVILAMPVFIIVWIARYLSNVQRQRREAQLWAEIRRIRRDEKIARPLKEFVEQKPLREQMKVPLRVQTASQSPPTLGNIGRFAALSIRGHLEEFFVRDDEGQVYGPADTGTIHTWIRERRITAATLLSNNTDGPWMAAQKIRALQEIFATTTSTPPNNRFDNLRIE